MKKNSVYLGEFALSGLVVMALLRRDYLRLHSIAETKNHRACLDVEPLEEK